MDPQGPRSPPLWGAVLEFGDELGAGGIQCLQTLLNAETQRPRPSAVRLPALILLLYESFPAQVLLPCSHGVLGQAH